MRRSVYVLVRYASLTVATFVLIGAPLAAAVRRRAARRPPAGPGDPRRSSAASFGAALLAACSAGLAALVAALTVRRGLGGGRGDRGAAASATPSCRRSRASRPAPATTPSARSPGCSRRTPWSTASRSSSSTPRAPPSRRRTGTAMGLRLRPGGAARRGRLVLRRYRRSLHAPRYRDGRAAVTPHEHPDRPRLPVVPQRRRGQRRLDDHRPRRHRPARPERRRQVHADRDDVRLPRAVDRHRHPRRRAAVAQRGGLPQDRAGARARGAVRLPDRAAVRGRQRRAARAAPTPVPRRSARSRWSR